MAKAKATEANALNWNIAELVERNKKGEIDFSVPIQRGYVWDLKRSSLLIHSILIGLPISIFFFNKVDGIYQGLEGKQRTKAICSFVNNEYKLHAQTPSVEEDGNKFALSHRMFSDLPDPLQNKILRYGLTIQWFDNANEEEKVLIFTRINSGKPVTPTEIARIRVKSRKDFLKMTEHDAIQIGVSAKNRAKCNDEDILEDIWCIANVESPSLLSKDRAPILASTIMTKEQKDEMYLALDYLLYFFKKSLENKKLMSKSRTKTHIVSLGYMAILAIRNKINEDDFVERATRFFDTGDRSASISKAYNGACLAGSAKAEQVRIRMSEIEKALLGG